MAIKIHRMLTSEEFTKLNNESKDQGMYSADPRVFTPGTVWQLNWFFDPTGERERTGKTVLLKAKDREEILSGKKQTKLLSMHYWKDWSHIRPPMVIVCPNGRQWEVDRLSRNGSGWKVSGDFPFITCHPSIDLPGYHGVLVAGLFGPDINGRGPDGIVVS